MEQIVGFIIDLFKNFFIGLISLVFHKNRLEIYKIIIIKHIINELILTSVWQSSDIEISNNTKISISDVRLILRQLDDDRKIIYSKTIKSGNQPKQVDALINIFNGFDSYSWIIRFEIELARIQIVNYLECQTGNCDSVKNLQSLVGDKFLTYAALGQLENTQLGRYRKFLGKSQNDFEFVM